MPTKILIKTDVKDVEITDPVDGDILVMHSGILKNEQPPVPHDGDVVGPISVVDGNLAVFDGTTGKLIKDGGAIPATHTPVSVSDSTTIDLTLTDQALTADLKNTTVTPGSYTNADLTVDAQGRITAVSDGVAGSADAVLGPASAVDGNIAVFDGTTGKLIKDGGAVPSAVFGTGEALYGKKLIYDNTLTAEGIFDVQNIPQDYDDLEFILVARTTNAATYDLIKVAFNNDTTAANYHEHDMYNGQTAGGGQTANPFIGAGPAATSPANSFGLIKGTISNYASTTKLKNWLSHVETRYDTAAGYTQQRSGQWLSTNAINRITIRGNTATNFAVGSRLQVFGTKNMVTQLGQSTVYAGTQLFRQTLVTPQDNFDITAIPSGYDYLEILIYGQSAAAGSGSEIMLVAFNGDVTDVNYASAAHYAGSSHGAGTGNRDIAEIMKVGSTSGVSDVRFIVQGYDKTAFYKSAVNHNQSSIHSGGTYLTSRAVEWKNTAAINRITIKLGSAANFVAGSTCIIIGYKNTLIGTPPDGWYSTDALTYSSADAPTFIATCSGDQTGKYSPGQRLCLTQVTGGKKYFIITAVSYSAPNTTITMYGGTDYTLTNEAITSPYFSRDKAPLGFPLNPAKWTVEFTDTTQRSQANPTQNTWYNLGSMAITIPIGIWEVSYSVHAYVDDTGSALSVYTTLSTANNSESDADFTSSIQSYDAASALRSISGQLTPHKTIALASKTVHYLNARSTDAGMSNLMYRNEVVKLIIRAVCAYL